MKKIALTILSILFVYNLQAQNHFPLRLKVGSYNIGHFNQGELGGFQGRHKEVEAKKWRAWVAEQGLDFLMVQEWNEMFDKNNTIKATEYILSPSYNNVYLGENKNYIFNGIATNYHLNNIRQVNWQGDYYAIIGDLKIGDKTIAIISTHIPWQEKWHLDDIENLIKELKKYEYFICAGDMNAKDPQQLRFIEEGFNMANGGNQGWFYTTGTANVESRANGHIDNIITSKNIKIMNVKAPLTGLNDQDHFPIMAELIITN